MKMNLFHGLIAIFAIAALGTTSSRANAQDVSVEHLHDQIFGDWKIVCDDKNLCKMVQSIVTEKSGQQVLSISIYGGKPATAVVQFPLGILLNTGWQFKVDSKKARLIPFEICKVNGCFAGIQLPDPILLQLKRGNILSIKFHDAAQKPITPKVSLKGFTKAYNTLAGT